MPAASCLFYAIKVGLAALIIVAVTEVSKVNAWLGALIKSLPIISLVAIVWLYYETRDLHQVAEVSRATFWLVLPTMPMFLVFPALVRHGWNFIPALGSFRPAHACLLHRVAVPSTSVRYQP